MKRVIIAALRQDRTYKPAADQCPLCPSPSGLTSEIPAPDYDVVVTTALVPGRPAPKLIPAAAVARMRPGSVIVDLAAETGGNCELTEPGRTVEKYGVTVMGELNRDYVTAARLAGAGLPRLMFITVLPNCMAPLIVQATLSFSSAILDAAALGFLGLGVQPPTPEWGTMLASARDYIERAWWVVSLPGLTILLSVLAINLMGDGLRDALDPKLKNAA